MTLQNARGRVLDVPQDESFSIVRTLFGQSSRSVEYQAQSLVELYYNNVRLHLTQLTLPGFFIHLVSTHCCCISQLQRGTSEAQDLLRNEE